MTIVDKTTNYAKFAKEHPLIIVGQVSLWVGPLAAPAALGALGFSATGIMANSLAASWQARMPLVKAGSLFSKLQSAMMGGQALGGLRAAIGSVAAAVTGITALSALLSPSEMEDMFRRFYRKGYVKPKL